jgi:UDP-N-acetylmuramyl pentapeptide synthase
VYHPALSLGQLHKSPEFGDTRHLAQAAISDGMPAEQVICVKDSAEAAKVLPPMLQKSDTILLKGSRGVKLELVAHALAGQPAMADAH